MEHFQQQSPEARSLAELLRAKIASDKQDSLIPKEHCTERPSSVLLERSTTHGEFEHYAAVSQSLKAALAGGVRWEHMQPAQREALEAVMGKLARIVTGDPDFLDHYRDIIGYTQRAMDCTAKRPQATDSKTTKFQVNGSAIKA